MRILINTILSTKHKVGVTEYLIGLINALQKIDDENTYFILTTKENRHFFKLFKNNFNEIIVSIFDLSRILLRIQYLFYSKFRLSSLLKKHRVDIFHEPSSWFVSKTIKTVVTIHDVVEIHNRKYSYLINNLKKTLIYSSIKNSKRIISVSNATTDQIKKLNGSNITTIYSGFNIPERNFEDSRLNSSSIKYTSLKPYLLFIGTLLLHKNLLTLLEAFKITANVKSEYKLVLAGKGGNASGKIKKIIDKNGLASRIHLTGYFQDFEKRILIENARCLILISQEEGFGFPILEAQAVGIPVITSNTSSMLEISRNSALHVDPMSISSISDGILRIINDDRLATDLVKRGFENVKNFNWDNCAANTLRIYKDLNNQK